MSLQSRREFLEQSMLAATAALAAGGVPRALRAAEKQAGPNDVLRVAILGVNGRGQSHLDGFIQNKQTEVVAIVDPDEAVGVNKGVAKVEQATGKKAAWYDDPRKILENKDIDIVSIATPNHWHSLAAIWAMQNGKDVYVEKPVSHNVAEGRRAVDAARKYNKICQTGTQCRSLAATIEAIKYVQDGKIGEVKLARGLCYKARPSIGARGNYDANVPPKVNYDVWCGPAPKHEMTRPRFHYDWHWQWDYGNGDLGNQGIHQMDIARWGLGVSDIGSAVLSYGGRLGYEDAGETANTQVSIHSYGDKTLVFEVRGLKTSPFMGAGVGNIFHGSEGYVVLSGYDRGAAFDPTGKMVQEFKGDGDHFGNFVDAVRSRDYHALHADILEGHLSSALCHLGNISYRLGEQVSLAAAEERIEAVALALSNVDAVETFARFKQHLVDNGLSAESTKIMLGAALTLDGKAEKFTGELAEKANPMLTREYRAPYVVPAAGTV